jgi:hypothetical protein
MQQLSCNAIPECHTRPNGDLISYNPHHNPNHHHHHHNSNYQHNPNYPPNPNPQQPHNNQLDVNYCVVPAKCVTNNGRIISTDLVYCHDDVVRPQPPHNSNEKYITKTIKPYKVVPTRNGTVGFLVEKNLPFSPGQSISCSILDNETNFFNGIVFDYDKQIGFLSIGSIDNVTGNFNNSVVYNINLILFDPEVVKLKERMDLLYKYLFQIDLESVPNYNPVSEQLQFFEKKVYNLILYLFDYDVRLINNYQITEEYLSTQIANVYTNLFDVDLTQVLNFNPNGIEYIMNSFKKRLYQIYLYLFSINLEQSPWFNPNTINN